jgi:threo-3-hydroxy-L-aspartate ammonia-lyase
MLAISYADIVAAHERIKPAAHRTPVLTSSTANALTGAQLFFKCENFQRMGAFKFRGGYNALAQFTPEQKKQGVVAFSSGNHAQAIALSARLMGMPAVIVMPQDAPAIKIAATRGYGAEVVLFDRYTENREAIGQRLAQERGLTLIPPYNHPHVMAGQGTAAKELFEDVPDLDYFFVCVGGGGLISGCATAAKALNPHCKVIGVEPEAGNDTVLSFKAGKIIEIPVPRTLADGAQTQAPGSLTFPIVQALVHDVTTASDAELVEAMQFFASRMKMFVEPTGALGAAAAMNPALIEQYGLKGKRVGVLVSGGNVDLSAFAKLVA